MEMGGNFCQILELGGTTIKGRRVETLIPGLPHTNENLSNWAKQKEGRSEYVFKK